MLSNDKQEILIQRLIDRIQQLNEDILVTIGENINKLGTVPPSKIHQLKQMLMYGENLDNIVKKISEVTNLNTKDIYDIFENEAKINQDFAKQFYKAKGIEYIPFEQNIDLKKQIKAISNVTAKEYVNISKTSAIGYTIQDNKGNTVFKDVSDIYKEAIDKASLNIIQGKTTQSQEIRNFLKQIGQSGLKTVNYKSGRTMRLDSALRMNIQQATRDITNNLQQQFGEEFGYNMVEISHHVAPAVDHSTNNIPNGQYDIDGHQFAKIDEIRKQIETGVEKDIKLSDIKENKVKVKGKWYYDFDYINNLLKRPVGELNCRHYIFTGILGINQPMYSEKQLKEDKKKNKGGFYLDGKHYTNYEGTQLQRLLERKIREQKDIQILAVASKDKELVNNAQMKITQYTNKYRQLCKASKLPDQLKTRGLVIGYKRVNVANIQ